MKTSSRLVVAAVFAFAVISSGEAQNARQRQLIDTGWRFELGDPADILTNSAETNVAYYPEISYLPKLEADEVSGTDSETYMETLRVDPVATHMGENVSFVQTNFDDSSWQLLNLPHDWVVALPFDSSADAGHGYKAGISGVTSSNTIAWYRRAFTLPASDAGQTLSLEFDGVYRNCLVWLNGHILGRNVSGYSSFYFDISQYANPGGTNVLVVRVDASRFEGWFYEGAGIYRHVWLVTTSPLHVAHWGTFVTSAVTGSNATVTVQTQINNDNTNFPATCGLISTILAPNGNAVSTTTTNSLVIAAGTNLVVTQTLQVTNAQLWSLQSPNLYQLVSTVTQAGTTNDIYQTPFGIRTIQFDPNLGLFLNGRSVKIQGACNHQDHAGVGTALPDRLQYYRIERLKEMGCNVYRTAHGPPTPELLDACDQLGMLVLDENRRIGANAEPLSELQRLILRDRNHPCVFCWSLANEEPLETDNTTGAPIMQVMVNLVHQLDPSRKCTAAMDQWSSGAADGFSTVLDVQGFNYLNHGGEDSFHSSNPTMPCFGTEEASTIFTRGIYANSSTYVSAYDVNLAGSYCSTAEAWWQYYTARPWDGGACDWTGFDYRGEPTPFGWPNISSEFGAMDTCGFPKDVYYYYQANWTGKTVLHIFPHWNWAGEQGQTINVWCFSDCDAVELFANGVSQGAQQVNVMNHEQWNVPYAPGALEAVGYRNGRPVITNTIATTGVPAGISLQPDRRAILADGMDVSVVSVAVVDAQGNVVPTATNSVSFTITGGNIIGVGNGDPACHQADKPATPASAVRSVFNGLAQVLVQSTNEAGTITLTASASGLDSTNVAITAALSLPPPPAPVDLLAAAGNGRIWLNWDNVPGAISYNVNRSTTSGGPYTTVAQDNSDSFFTDTEVTNGVTYYYVVSAMNTNGAGADSIEVSATPLPLPAPTTPTGLTAAPFSSTAISLAWSASPAATAYYVKRSTTNGGPYAVVGLATNTTFVDTGLTNTLTYYYVVSATNSAGVSADSAQAGAKPEGQATMPDIGAGAPTPGEYDIFQLLNTDQNNDYLNYYTDNGANHNEWCGQTFATGTNATGYVLNTVAWKSAGNGSDFGNVQLYDLYIYSLSDNGNTATLTASYQASAGGNQGDWFQWQGLNVPLAPNGQYACAFGLATGIGGDYEEIADQSGSPFDGSQLSFQICQIPAQGGAVTYGQARTSSATFDLGLSLPQVSYAILPTYSPNVTPIYAGTTVTLSEAPVGPGPFNYQWLTDGGSGNTPTNIAGATGSTFIVNTASFAPGNYNYAVIVNNDSGSPISAVLTLTIIAASAPQLATDIAPAPVNFGYVGQTETYSASFIGTLPISYQWMVNTGSGPVPISAASNPSALSNTLVLANLQLTNAGTYSVVANNSVGGPVSSSPSTLTVLADQAPPGPGTYGALILSYDPVAFWPLNETNNPASGRVPAYDASGNDVFGLYGSSCWNGFNGVQGPQPPVNAGFPANNTALETFANAATNCFVAASVGGLQASGLTYAMWINPGGPVQNWAGLLMDRGDISQGGEGFGFGGNVNGSGMSELGYTWNQNSTWSFNSGLYPPANQWSLVALVIQPTAATIYLISTNGVQTAVNSIAHDSEPIGVAWRIGDDEAGDTGGGVGARTFPGKIADACVFLSALSSNQVAAIYNASVKPPPITLSVSPLVNGNVTLTWSQGTLLEATNLAGPWSAITGAASPLTFKPTNPAAFFQVQSN